MRGIELGKARTLEPCHQKKNRPSATLSGTAILQTADNPRRAMIIGGALRPRAASYDGCLRSQVRGVLGSVVTRREGSNSLGTASLVAAARPCKGLGAAGSSELIESCAKGCTRQKCMRSSRTIPEIHF